MFYSDAFFDFDVIYSLSSSTAASFKPFQLCPCLSIFFWSTYVSSACLNVFLYTFSPMALQPKSRIGRLFLRFLYQKQLDTLSVDASERIFYILLAVHHVMILGK
jgi:hypothetical protein